MSVTVGRPRRFSYLENWDVSRRLQSNNKWLYPAAVRLTLDCGGAGTLVQHPYFLSAAIQTSNHSGRLDYWFAFLSFHLSNTSRCGDLGVLFKKLPLFFLKWLDYKLCIETRVIPVSYEGKSNRFWFIHNLVYGGNYLFNSNDICSC